MKNGTSAEQREVPKMFKCTANSKFDNTIPKIFTRYMSNQYIVITNKWIDYAKAYPKMQDVSI